MIKTVISFNANQLISMSKQISNRYKPDVYTIHKFVYSLFPKELNAKFSFNKELIKNGKQYIIIQSDKRPIIPSFIDADQIKSYVYDDDFFENKEFNFVIDINSSKRLASNGKYSPVKPDEIIDWITLKFEKNNLHISFVNLISQSREVFYAKNNNKVTIYHSKLIGRVKTSDKESIKNAMINGIGRGKTYGYGMLILN